MLLRPEPAPVRVVEELRDLRPEDPVDRRVAVGDVHAGDLVAARHARRVERRRRVSALGEPAQRLVGRIRVVGVRVEDEARVERIRLAVQAVARVLDERELVAREERDVVGARCGLVRLVTS